jgi:hypothetical protein
MGRRSRQRGAAPVAAPPPAPASARGAGPRSRREERLGAPPKAPWHPVPLVELAVLAGLILVVAGFVVGDERGGQLVGGGIALVSLAGLELAIREHVTGYRSHSSLLAIACAVAVMAGLSVAGLGRVLVVLAGVAAGVSAFAGLRELFQRKAGGLTWRA